MGNLLIFGLPSKRTMRPACIEDRIANGKIKSLWQTPTVGLMQIKKSPAAPEVGYIPLSAPASIACPISPP